MCGIVGILNLRETAPPDEKQVRDMLAMIRHRGPDQYGIYLAPRAALGNARLSIIDLAGGQQPISNEDQSLWIVFLFSMMVIFHLMIAHCRRMKKVVRSP